jgi:L-iditol 2-dehydrogenase
VNLCVDRRVVGVAPDTYRQHGAFAEFLALPSRILHRLPSGLDFVQAAFVEPTAIAVHAVGRAAIKPGCTAAVVGSGMIGLLVIQALRWAGAGRIIAIDLSEERLKVAQQLGATDVVSAGSDTAAAVLSMTDGVGADVAFEVVGIGKTLNLALGLVRRGGTCVLVGNLHASVDDFPLQSVVTREVSVLGSCGSAGEYPLCLDLLQRGVIQTGPLTSAVVPLSEGAAWFQALSAAGGSRYLKVILRP